MHRREISSALIASMTGAALLPRDAQSQTCTAPCYARTQAEINAGVTPTNTQYLPGDLRRYGADPTCNTPSATAITNAILSNAYVFDGYPGGGTYLVEATVPVQSVTRIQGACKQGSPVTASCTTGPKPRGTTFVLTSPTSGAALFHATTYIEDLHLSDLTITWLAVDQGQIGLLVDTDCRSCRITDCVFYGADTATTNITAMRFNGSTSGGYTGDLTIERNYITAVQTAISLNGPCSSVRILSNEVYCQSIVPSSCGVYDNSVTGGVVIAFNTFEGWTRAIYTAAGGVRQLFNYFEDQVLLDFDWGTTHFNTSFGDYNTGPPLSNALYNNSSGNTIFGGEYGATVDSTAMYAWRGFTEQGRTVANGHQQVRAYDAANYSGLGTLSFGVTAASLVTEKWTISGNEATFYCMVNGAMVSGTGTALLIALPAGVMPSDRTGIPCRVLDNGTAAFGFVEVYPNIGYIYVFRDATQASNWTPSEASTGFSLQIKFPINYAVN